MSAKIKNFIVVSIGDTGGYGYDEHSLPILLQLVDSSCPEHRVFTHTGVIGHFRTSRKNIEIVRRLVAEAESLRVGDVRFAELKIGVAQGDLIGEFDWLGRLKRGRGAVGLIGGAILEAVRCERSGDYAGKLESIGGILYRHKA